MSTLGALAPLSAARLSREWVRKQVSKAPMQKVLPVHQSPSENYLLSYLLFLSLCALVATTVFKHSRSPKKMIRSCGVSLKKVARSCREIERKGFHLAGLLVPIIYLLLMRAGWSQAACARLCWAITSTGCCSDALRLRVDFVRRNWPLRSILREHEQSQLTGGTFFSLGCTLAISLFPPGVAMTSILFLVLGDMSAALIGVSFGGDVSQHRARLHSARCTEWVGDARCVAQRSGGRARRVARAAWPCLWCAL